MFQSLFFWISIKGSMRHGVGPLGGWSFNPCSSGSPSRASCEDCRRWLYDEFQSLFFWISIKGIIDTCWFEAVIVEFQSLFFWISIKGVARGGARHPGSAVSILVLLDLHQGRGY